MEREAHRTNPISKTRLYKHRMLGSPLSRTPREAYPSSVAPATCLASMGGFSALRESRSLALGLSLDDRTFRVLGFWGLGCRFSGQDDCRS